MGKLTPVHLEGGKNRMVARIERMGIGRGGREPRLRRALAVLRR